MVKLLKRLSDLCESRRYDKSYETFKLSEMVRNYRCLL